MKIYFISFTTTTEDIGYTDFETRLIRMNKSAEKVGIDRKNIITWTRKKLKKTNYYEENRVILDAKMGAGYWLWKPIIIYDQMQKLNEGDILIYCDNSMIFNLHPQPLIDVCVKNRGFFLVHFPKKNSELAKRDAFHYMGLDTPEYANAFGCQSNILIFQKNQEVMRFLNEWLTYCKDPRIITDAPNTCGKENYPDYDKANDRLSDMKVLSLLKVKYQIETYRNPNQYGDLWKMPQFRNSKDFVEKGKYDESNIANNSPYETIFNWEKHGLGVKRPISHLFNPVKIYYILKRKIFK